MSHPARPTPTRPAVPDDDSPAQVTRRVPLPAILTAFAVGVLLLAAWRLQGLVLMAFGAVVIAVALRAGAEMLHEKLGIKPWIGVLIVAGTVVGTIAAFVMFVGPAVSEQFRALVSGLPEAWRRVEEFLRNSAIGELIAPDLGAGADAPAAAPSGEGGGGAAAAQQAAQGLSLPSVFNVLRGTLTTVTGSLANLILLLTMAIFLAMHPREYLGGALRLVPVPHRPRAREIAHEIGGKLAKWLAGQALTMLIVGLLIFCGLWALGVPLALVLGLIAGLTNIIPILGPFIGAVPAILFALTQGPETTLYVALLFLVVQQLEGNLLMPMIQKRAANLPPVLTILAVIGFGTLFGLPGVLLATPLLLVLMIAVQRLYVEDILGDDQPAD